MYQPEAATGADRRETMLLLAVAAVVALVFLASMLYSTRGQFVPQVVDLYLVGQYARAMAEGHPFQYNAGEAASTGATSLLHTGILAAAHRVGIRGEWLIAFAILSGVVLYLATVKMARDVGALLGGRREGWLAGGLVALGGPVVWGFLYGADIALFMFLTTWLLRSLLAAWPAGRFGPVVAPAVLAALTRPEGLPLAILVAVGWRLGPGKRARGGEGVLPWVAPAAGLLVLVNNRVFTGAWVGTSLADKSLFANFGIPTAAGMVAEYGVDVIRGLLLGFYPSSATIGFNRGWAALCFPPLGLLLVAAAALRRHPLTTPVRLWLLATADAVRPRLAEHVPGHPFQSLHPLGLPHPARPGRGGRRASWPAPRAGPATVRSSTAWPRSSSCWAHCRRCASPRSTVRWRATSTGATSPPPAGSRDRCPRASRWPTSPRASST